MSNLADKILKSLQEAIDATCSSPNEIDKDLSTALVRALENTEILVNMHRQERAPSVLAPEEWEDLV